MMDLFKFVVISLVLSSNLIVDTYTQRCTSYKTIFAPERSAAIFRSFSSNSSKIRFYKTNPTFQIFLKLRESPGDNSDDLTIYEEYLLKNRVAINVTRLSNNQSEIRIELKNVGMKDNGTYLLMAKEQHCFVLFVMKIEFEPNEFLEENEPVFIHADPLASVVAQSISNATMVWSLDGISVEHSAYFVKYDGILWISKVKREFHGKTVTYRALQDDGNEIDVSYVLNVSYGPSFPLNITPRITHYSLITGDSMPDVICTTECNPPCNISWEKYSAGRVLSLGTVNTDDSGDYTCTASRFGSREVHHTISVLVSDDTSFTMNVLIGLITFNALITIALALCVFNVIKRRGHVFCCFYKTKKSPEPTGANGTNSATI